PAAAAPVADGGDRIPPAHDLDARDGAPGSLAAGGPARDPPAAAREREALARRAPPGAQGHRRGGCRLARVAADHGQEAGRGRSPPAWAPRADRALRARVPRDRGDRRPLRADRREPDRARRLPRLALAAAEHRSAPGSLTI